LGVALPLLATGMLPIPAVAGGAREEVSMNLSPREIDKLYVYVVADLARKRRDRGVKLNYSEAVALISEAILESARDGRTVAECMEVGRKVVGAEEVMPGVRAMLPLLQIEAAFVDGTKLVSCHDPVGA